MCAAAAHIPGEKMKRYFLYLIEILKALGRIIAAVAMLNFRLSFNVLRISQVLVIACGAYGILKNFSCVHAVAGFFLVAVGAAFVVWTHQLVQLHPISSGKLLTVGPFAVVRHPMYSGMCLVSIGAAVLARMTPVTVLAVLQVIFMLSVSCGEDEENLEIFGRPYAEYQKKVWLSGIFTGTVRAVFRKLRKTA